MKKLLLALALTTVMGCSTIKSILPGGTDSDTVLKGIAVTELALTGAVDVVAGLAANGQISPAAAGDIETNLRLVRTYMLKARGYMLTTPPDTSEAQTALNQANDLLAKINAQEKQVGGLK